MHRTPWATGEGQYMARNGNGYARQPQQQDLQQNQQGFGSYKSRGEAVAARAQMRANNVDNQLEQMRAARCARAHTCCLSTNSKSVPALQDTRQ